MTSTQCANPAWGQNTRTQLSASRSLAHIVPVSHQPTGRADALAAAADEDDWPVQHVDGRMSLEPSAGQESDDSYPVSLHGSPCCSPLPPLPRTGETESEQGAGLVAEHAVPFSIATGRRPTLSSPREYVACQADRLNQCAFLAVVNIIALLSNSVVTLVERSTTEAEEISKAASTALTLCASVAVSQARISAWVTQIQRHLQQASVTETPRKVLLDAPISPYGLFGPQFHAMVESMKMAAEQADGIRQHVS